MDLSEKMKKNIIDLFCNTKLRIPEILRIVNIDNKITLEQIYDFLYEYRTEKGEKIKRKHKDYISDMDNEIYSLRKQGKSYEEIANILKENGIQLTVEEIKRRKEKIFSLKDEKDSIKKDRRKTSIDISGEEIFERRLKGTSFKDILTEYRDRGITVSYDTIRNRYKSYCSSIGYMEEKSEKVEGKTEKKNSRIMQGREEELYYLRTHGYPYEKIKEYYLNKGVNVSYETIRKECKKVFSQKGKKEPMYTKYDPENKGEKDVTVMVYILRRQGYSYQKITDYLISNGAEISLHQVRMISQKMFEKYNKKEPRMKSDTARSVSKKRIYDMRKEGVSCKKITEILNNEGIHVSYGYLVKECREIFKNKGEEMPSIKRKEEKHELDEIKNKQTITNLMLEVAKKKNATKEQLRKFSEEISKYYKIDIDIPSNDIEGIDDNER